MSERKNGFTVLCGYVSPSDGGLCRLVRGHQDVHVFDAAFSAPAAKPAPKCDNCELPLMAGEDAVCRDCQRELAEAEAAKKPAPKYPAYTAEQETHARSQMRKPIPATGRWCDEGHPKFSLATDADAWAHLAEHGVYPEEKAALPEAKPIPTPPPACFGCGAMTAFGCTCRDREIATLRARVAELERGQPLARAYEDHLRHLGDAYAPTVSDRVPDRIGPGWTDGDVLQWYSERVPVISTADAARLREAIGRGK